MILADRYNYPAQFHEKSKDVLETALNTAPAYGGWKVLDRPDAAIDERYDALPELNKQIMRDHFPTGLIPNYRDLEAGLDSEQVEYTFTSGTTGDRVVNIWDQNWWDSSEISAWKLSAHTKDLKHPLKEAKLASALNVGISCEEDLPMSHRTVGSKLYLNEKISIIQWQRRHYERMARELGEFKPDILEANPSLLARLAYWAIDEGVKLFSPSAIVFTYELPSKIHLKAISEVFSAPLISSYGTTETGFVMQECESGSMHQNVDFCRIDFEPLKDKYGGPELGRMLVTTFNNPWNIIVRFDVGDLIRLHPSGECECGRSEGLIARAIEGRVTNSTFATDGGLITTAALDDVLSKVEGIRDYHLEQNTPESYELELMIKGDEGRIVGETREALKELYGSDGKYDIKVLKNIWPGPAGKFRRTQVNFDFDFEELFV